MVVKDHNNNVTRVVGITVDISARKQTEANLLENEERIRLATAAAELGMWFWDLTTNQLVWTAKCKQLFGLAANTEMSYELFFDCLHPDDCQPTREAIGQTLAGKADYDVEYRVIWPNGSLHWIAAKGRCLYDEAGKPVRRILIVDDDADTRQFLGYLLQEYGATVTITASANEGFTALEQSKYDLLISDLGMPEVDGYSLMRQIRTTPLERGGNIPAIALTAYAGDSDRSQV